MGFARRVTEVTYLDLSPAAMCIRREQASRERARARRAFVQFLLILGLAVAALLAALWGCR